MSQKTEPEEVRQFTLIVDEDQKGLTYEGHIFEGGHSTYYTWANHRVTEGDLVRIRLLIPEILTLTHFMLSQ